MFLGLMSGKPFIFHDDVIKWKHFQRHWPFARGIHRSPVDSPHKGQWRGALMLSLMCTWTNGWWNNRDDGDLKRHRAHYDVTLMWCNGKYKMFAASLQDIETFRRIPFQKVTLSTILHKFDISQPNIDLYRIMQNSINGLNTKLWSELISH